MIISLLRSIKAAIRDFYRNIWLSFATILVIVLSLVSVNFLVVINFLSDSAISSVQEKIDVSVYFKPEIKDEQVYEIEQKLRSQSEVKDVQFVSPDEALLQFKERHKDNPKILSALDEINGNPLGATLVIKAHDPSQYPQIISFLDAPEYDALIFEKNYIEHKDIIDTIQHITTQVKNFAIVVSLIFVFISMIVVYNALRVMIYTHRDELKIMKLVGASTWFTRAPYVIESIFYSIFAVVISFIILFPILNILQPFIGSFLGNTVSILTYYQENALYIIGLQTLIVVTLNMLSSIIATRRYVRI